MDRLYAVAFPELAPEDSAWIESLRARHDPAGHGMLAAHFTFVFGCSGLGQDVVRDEIRSVADQTPPIRFVLRRALAAEHRGSHYVYLCPQEGADRMTALRHRLHAGTLASCLDAREPFVPHVTVCKTTERDLALALCDCLNGGGMQVPGTIRSLSLGALEGDAFQVLAHAPLAAAT